MGMDYTVCTMATVLINGGVLFTEGINWACAEGLVG